MQDRRCKWRLCYWKITIDFGTIKRSVYYFYNVNTKS